MSVVINFILICGIALFYNIFVHGVASTIYSDQSFAQKFKNTTVFILIVGILSLALGIYFLRSHGYNSIVSKGISLGGALLIATAIFVNWDQMTDLVRLFLSGLLLFGTIWVTYNYTQKAED